MIKIGIIVLVVSVFVGALCALISNIEIDKDYNEWKLNKYKEEL